jgi:PrsW family intramembrane metalloprotease
MLVSVIQVLVLKNGTESGSILLGAAALILVGFLCLPSVYYPLCRMFNWKAIDLLQGLRRIRPSLLIFLYPVVLLLGYWVIQLQGLTWVLLPALHVLAVGLPVLWILYVTVRGLPSGSLQRLWGVFDSGLVLGPALILAFELFALLIFGLIAVFAISNQPALVEIFQSFSQQFSTTPPTQDDIIKLLIPLLQQPGVLLAVLAFAAVVVPVIEEIFKPIGVWLLGNRRLTPAAGFAAGALSGAGYALFESLMLSTGGEAWTAAVVARAGTAVLHIATSSLLGWALVRAWNESRFFQLGLAYLAAVLVHGLWNALAVVTAYTSLSSEMQISFVSPEIVRWLEAIVPATLIILVTIIFMGLVWANRRLVILPAPGISPAFASKSIDNSSDSDNKPEIPAVEGKNPV